MSGIYKNSRRKVRRDEGTTSHLQIARVMSCKAHSVLISRIGTESGYRTQQEHMFETLVDTGLGYIFPILQPHSGLFTGSAFSDFANKVQQATLFARREKFFLIIYLAKFKSKFLYFLTTILLLLYFELLKLTTISKIRILNKQINL